MSKEPRTSEEITADLAALAARIRGQHARYVADRHREEVAPERRARLTLVANATKREHKVKT